MSIQRKIGIGLITLGVLMFLIGISLFSYQGTMRDQIIRDLGQISFMLWLPTLIAGIVLVTRRQTPNDNRRKA